MSEDHNGLRAHLQQSHPIPLNSEIDCAPGEMLALVGPSGSGKTTILRAIAGLNRPARGRVVCSGEIWYDTNQGIWVSPQRRQIGLVFQNYALFPHLSALDNIATALTHLSPAQRVDRARELLDMVHLTGLEVRRPAQLSGGQRQRVALARALAREPAALLLDEPFSAVDQVTRRKLKRELAVLRRQINVPTVLVTHDLEEATTLADRICVMHRGRTLQSGPPLELMTRPHNELVAHLMDLGNIFEGIILEHRPERGRTLLRWLDFQIEAGHTSAGPPGTKISWVIPPSFIILHRRLRPSRGDRENPVHGAVGELAPLGEQVMITMYVAGKPDVRLTFSLPAHVATRNGLARGTEITVSLLAEGIHIMLENEATAEERTLY